MQDMLGRELKVGDFVTAWWTQNGELALAEIIGFSDKTSRRPRLILNRHPLTSRTNDVLRLPEQVAWADPAQVMIYKFTQ